MSADAQTQARPALDVRSQRLAETGPVPAGVAIAISIVSPGVRRAAIPDGYAALLRLEFDDVDVDTPPMSAEPLGVDGAVRLASFIRWALTQSPETIMIHCAMGAGRSAGVALGIADGLEYPADTIAAMEDEFPIHNRGVRRLVRLALAQVIEPPLFERPVHAWARPR